MSRPPTEKKGPSLQEALTRATRLLEEVGIDSARLDAEILLGEVMGLPRHQLYARLHDTLEKKPLGRFKRAISKRSKRIPLQYLVGHVEFMSLDFLIKKGIFIPRPETELVVEAVLERADVSKEVKILDIGTGSGNIAVSLAAMLTSARVFASDISQKALRLARLNAERYLVEDRVSFLHGSLYEPFEGLGLEGHVDFIVSNPPYVPEGEWKALQPEVRDYEDPRALLGGGEGLDCYRVIVKGAPRWLRPGGWLVLELGEDQADGVEALLRGVAELGDITLVKDLQGIRRVIIARQREG